MTAAMALPDSYDPTEEHEQDWHLAQVLHSQHVPLKEIAERAHVGLRALDKRIEREGWVAKREHAKAIVSVTVKQATNGQSVTIQAEHKTPEHSALLLGRLQRRFDCLTAGWDTLKAPKADSERNKALDLLSKATDIGKTLFGWGAQSSTSVIRLDVLQALQLPAAQPTSVVANTIDVPSSTVPEPPEQVEGRP